MSTLAGHGVDYTRTVWLVASGLGVAAVVALYGLYRRARSRHELEEAEALLAED